MVSKPEDILKKIQQGSIKNLAKEKEVHFSHSSFDALFNDFLKIKKEANTKEEWTNLLSRFFSLDDVKPLVKKALIEMAEWMDKATLKQSKEGTTHGASVHVLLETQLQIAATNTTLYDKFEELVFKKLKHLFSKIPKKANSISGGFGHNALDFELFFQEYLIKIYKESLRHQK